MSEFLTEYIRSELFILIPVLWLVGKGLKKSAVNDRFIPVILGTLGVILACVYVAASCEFYSVKCVLSAIFAGITQGLLCAGASVYFNEIIRNLKKKN
ncbi:MAG: phage holin family protein [Oscillospiraceae bacterium]